MWGFVSSSSCMTVSANDHFIYKRGSSASVFWFHESQLEGGQYLLYYFYMPLMYHMTSWTWVWHVFPKKSLKHLLAHSICTGQVFLHIKWSHIKLPKNISPRFVLQLIVKMRYIYRPRSEGDNALGSVRPSIRPSVCLSVRLCALSRLNKSHCQFKVYVHFGESLVVRLYSEIDHTYLSIEAQCVSHHYPRWTATKVVLSYY